jgi:hypothetical protein
VRKTLLAICLLGAFAGTATAAQPNELTLYRSDDASLFGNDGAPVQAGYALVREQRTLQLDKGVQDVALGGLPRYLDPEALTLEVPGGSVQVLSQRLHLAQGADALVGDLLGRQVDVLANDGQTLATGKLVSARDGALQIRQGDNTLVFRDYTAVRVAGDVDSGARLNLRVDAAKAGTTDARLSYVTAGMGWRASYVGTLGEGGSCRLALQSRASVANRSGSDWHDAMLTLIAGEPQLTKPGAAAPMMAMAFRGKSAAQDMPEASALADYRSYRLSAPVDLPDGTVSLLPLYRAHDLACTRTALYEVGNAYQPPQPMTNPSVMSEGSSAITSMLEFRAFDALPAGYLRVLARDARGAAQIVGESRIEDTPKGGDVVVTLGNVFDLRAKRERTAFEVNQKGRAMNEAFRVTLSNAGDSARTVTVREHPSRWREWKLASSSVAPSKVSPDTLTFKVEVPAGGETTLDYAVRYTWTADDQPQ